MNVPVYNPETKDLEKTYLSQYTAKNSTVLAVKDNDRFVNGRRVLLGRMGDERAELRTLSAVNSNKLAVTVDNTVFDHNSDEPIYLLDYDKVRFWKATAVDATYTVLQTVDIDVDNRNGLTIIDDPNALSSSWYRFSFVNSITGAESELSDPVSSGGFQETSAGEVIDQVVRRVRDTHYTVLSSQEYLDIMNEVGADLITQAQKPYRFLKKRAKLSTVANQPYIDLGQLPRFWKFNHFTAGTLNGGVSRFLQKDPISSEDWYNKYDNNQALKQDGVMDIAIDEEENKILIYPTPKTSQTEILKVSYYKYFNKIKSVGDMVETPNILIYRYKLMAEFYAAKSEVDNQWARLSEKYEVAYRSEIAKMQRVNRLDVGTPRSMRPRRSVRRRRYHL